MTLQDVIEPQHVVTLHGLFVERVGRNPNKIAYRYFENNSWTGLTWQQMSNETARWQAALAELKLQRGDRVAIMLRNCPQWVMFDQAAMSLGLVVVPLYTVDRPDNLAYILNNAEAKVLLFETDEQWQGLNSVREQLTVVQHFISLNALRVNKEPRLQSAAQFLPARATLRPDAAPDTKALASIIYTSGTTGKPKGVMLSHANILSNARAALNTFVVRGDDLYLSFLPLSHTFERTCGYYLQVMTGATVAYARSVPQLSEDLLTVKPTILVSVPRIYERVYGAIRNKLAEGTPIKRALFKLAVDTGWQRFEHAQGRAGWRPSFLLWPILQKLVAQKILDKLGGNLRVAITGGAALSPEISRVFVGLGLAVVQGFGLTETSPIVTGNKLENNFPDSAGQPVTDVQIRLGENNALLVKGPNVMMGYWRNEEATRAMIDADGWLNTGDTARISNTGHVYITGRIKEIIVMSNGEKVPPTDMELAILHDPLFEQVMVYGEGRPYLVALAALNHDTWVQFAAETGVRSDMPEALTDSRVHGKVLKRIALNLRQFPGYAKINRVLLLDEPWSIENGLLTPTLKIKRAKVVEKFAAQVEELYRGH
jgi:long-chain acyl-CoA synthetase